MDLYQFDLDNTQTIYTNLFKNDNVKTKQTLSKIVDADLEFTEKGIKLKDNSLDAYITIRINTIIKKLVKSKDLKLNKVGTIKKYLIWLIYLYTYKSSNAKIIYNLKSYIEVYFKVIHDKYVGLNTAISLPYYILAIIMLNNIYKDKIINTTQINSDFSPDKINNTILNQMNLIIEEQENYEKAIIAKSLKLNSIEQKNLTNEQIKEKEEINNLLSIDTTKIDEIDEEEEEKDNNINIEKSEGPINNYTTEFDKYLKQQKIDQKKIFDEFNMTTYQDISFFDDLKNNIKQLDNKNLWIAQLKNGSSYNNIKNKINNVYDNSIDFYKKTVISLRYINLPIETIFMGINGKYFFKDDENKKEINSKYYETSKLSLFDIRKIADSKYKEYISNGIESIKKQYPFVDFNKILV